jgi:opacity protein-like surface antigen
VKPLAIFLALTPCLCAQHLGYGIKIGVPFTDVFSLGSTKETNRFAAGPMFEVRLPIIGIEFDALYHNVSFTPATGGVSVGGGSWQFPITGKVRLPATPILKPYGEIGVAFRTFSGNAPGFDPQSKKGFVLGAGLEIHAIVIRITPELRYTRWGSGSLNPLSTLRANENQFEFLVGFSR